MNTSRSSIQTAGIKSIFPLKGADCKPGLKPADYRDGKVVQRGSKWVKVPWKRSDSVAGVFQAFKNNGAGSSRNSTPRRMSIKGTFALRRPYLATLGSRPSSSLSTCTQTTALTKLEEIESLCDSVDHIIREWNGMESSKEKRKNILSRSRSLSGEVHDERMFANNDTFSTRGPTKVALSECGDWHVHTGVLQDHIKKRAIAKRRRKKLLEIGARAGLNVKEMMSP